MSSAKSIDGGSKAASLPKSEPKAEKSDQSGGAGAGKAERAEAKSPARDAWAKDSFEASKPKPKLDLNPSAPPANTDTEAARAKQDPAKAARDADADRRAQIDAELARTETGRRAQSDLERSGAQVTFEDGRRSYFDPSNNRVVLGRDQSPTDAASALVNESVHAAAWKDGTSADPSAMSRDQYVDTMVNEEARSSAAEIEHRRELAAQGQPTGQGATSLDREYGDAYGGAIANGQSPEAAKEAARAAVLAGVRGGDAVAGVSGQRYGDYYGQQYDKVAAGEISAAQVARSDDVPPLQHPEKIGVVLNAMPDDLPSADQLTQAGVKRVRLTVTAEHLQTNKDALPDQEGGGVNKTRMDTLADTLAKYRAAGIEVTVNLPPELVAGKPEFKRTGGDQTVDPKIVHLQNSTLEDVDEDTWKTYEDNHAGRVGEVVDALHDSVDNWEVSNEPDATERNYIRGTLPPEPGAAPGTPNPHQQYVDTANGRLPVLAGFDPGLPANRYGHLLNREYAIIKSKDPGRPDEKDPTKTVGNKVLTAGLISGDPEKSIYETEDGKKSYLEEAWKANGNELKFDAIAVHPYGKNDPGSFKTLVDNYEAVSRKIGGGPVELYVTEASPGALNKDKPEDQEAYSNYVRDIGSATDQDPNISGTYFFWGNTADGHIGLVNMPRAMDTFRKMQGK